MWGAIAIYPPAAGAVSAIGATLLSVEFDRALIIAAVTGVIAAVGTVIGAMLASRYAQRAAAPIADDVNHVKRALDVNRRQDDVEPVRDNDDDGARKA